MRSDDPRLSPIELDGQRLLLPSGPGWETLRRDGRLDGLPLGAGRRLETYLAIADRSPELRVALGRPAGEGEARQPWILCHLAPCAAGWRRVRVRSQTCFGCGWVGVTGTARDYAIYEGSPDPLAALAAGEALPTLPCPDCGAALPEPPIWAQTVRQPTP
ncbi:MAG: hypothetical protein KC543_14340 [Myxococcales bacterium]|nr:hypothetical protein [Myxococcales bacterium]